MRNYKRSSLSLVLWLFFVAIGSQTAGAQTPLKTINNPQGGVIVYGLVDGATTQAAAMSKVLRIVHNNCGERPQVGRIFKVRGTNSVAVFFTVVNHPQGNKQVAGLLIAAPSGPNQIDAALVSDDAARFGSTVNPMLNRLFSEWDPGGAGQASGPATGGHSALAARLHTVAASDNSVSIGVPDGWTVDPASGHGTIVVKGPHGEAVAINMMRNAVDSSSAWQQNFWRMGGRPIPGTILYPYHGNLIREFPNLVQAWRRAGGLGPAKLQVDKIDRTPPPQGAPQGEECVIVKGQLDPDGRGMRSWSEMMCATLPANEWRGYMVIRHQSLFPNSLAAQQQPTVEAMIPTWRQNAEVLNQELAADIRRKQADDAAIRAQTRVAIDNIHAIGQQATARYNATQAANDAQHAGYWAQQDTNARNSQSFSNYLLDQTVIQDNNMYGNGTIGHGTAWNSTADALVKANPNRYEIVNTPNFWKGVDY
ncbi:MAG: hypothetical protein LAO04_03485 [Acidobacteriia bacterium]|nr:hypothetical protein [Terriglobia bacterium]